MSQKRERAASRQRSALTQDTKSLTSFVTTNSASLDFRQVPIAALRLARRFGMNPVTAAAVAQANDWGRA